MYKDKKISVIIAAAGSGVRMGGGPSKQYLNIGGVPVLARAIRAFALHPLVDEIYVMVRKEDMDLCRREILQKHKPPKVRAIISGGKERQDTVFIALDFLERAKNKDTGEGFGGDYVLIHDGARPFVRPEVITRVVEAAVAYGAAVPGIPVKDTIKRAGGQWLAETLDRSNLFSIQTPQGFERKALREAHLSARKAGFLGTDDAVLIERAGGRVALVRGDLDNIKITTPEDLPGAEAIGARFGGPEPGGAERGAPPCRVGLGFDVHGFAEDRELVLGGVKIPYPRGLQGHSDADVLLHAVMDAILGACGLGDIGRHFPDKDPRYQGISSLLLLEQVRGLAEAAGFAVGNVDATLIGENPKIAPYAEDMRSNIAAALRIDEALVNVKATTTEKLGFCGREEGLAAEAVATCLLLP